MTQPTRTPNPATTTRPQRSSERVAHKKPLAWLPWLALLALLALAALIWFVLAKANHNANDGDGNKVAAGPAGQAAPAAVPTAGSAAAPGGVPPAGAKAAVPGAGAPSAAAGVPGPGAVPGVGAAGALAGALVGGAGQPPTALDSAGRQISGAQTGGGSAGAAVAAPAPGTAGTVLFAEGDATPDADGRQVVTAAAQSVRASGAKRVEVRGYTDVVAGAPINAPLSQQRADNVAQALRPLLPGVAVTTVGKADADPVASNDTSEGRQQNRRTAIVATG